MTTATAGELKTRTIPNVELLHTGTFEGVSGGEQTYTIADLRGMVEAYQATKSLREAPVKIGHTDDQALLQNTEGVPVQDDGMPAAGWVRNLRLKGNTLVGDLEDVPEVVARLMDANAYRYRSVELWPDFEIGGKTWPWWFAGVALLGADVPAVEGLADIEALYHAQGGKPVVVKFSSQPGEKECAMGIDYRKELAKRLGLAEDASDADMEAKLASPEPDGDEGSDGEPAPKYAANAAAAEVVSLRTNVTALTAKLAETERVVLSLQARATTLEAEKAVDAALHGGELLPAQREFAMRLALRDMNDFKAFLAQNPKGENGKVIEFGLRGGSGGPAINFADLEPTEMQRSQAAQLHKSTGGYTHEVRLGLIEQNAKAKGVTLPSNWKDAVKAS